MEKSSFFNSISHDRTYKAEDWAEYFASFIGNGVFPVPSTGLQVVANDGMKLNVKTGKAWINGYFYFNTGDLAVELDTADGQLNRIDRVVVRWDLTNRVMSVKVKSSSFSASPTAPALQRDADVYELALADIYVGAGVTAITQSKITDQRLNTSLCGVVAAVVQQIDTAAFNAQLQAWFAEYQSLSAAEYNTLVSSMNSLKLQGNTQYEAFEQHMADFETQAAADYQHFQDFAAVCQLHDPACQSHEKEQPRQQIRQDRGEGREEDAHPLRQNQQQKQWEKGKF